MDLVWIILLIINILLYGICCFLILRRKSFTCISIRSPRLLILNIIGNLLMTIIIILTEGLENISDKKICSLFYYITNFLIIIPLCLRFRRIVKCCEIKLNDRFEIQDFGKEKYKLEEKYNIKLMLIIFVILSAILVVVNVSITTDEWITAKFLYYIDINDEGKFVDANSIIWLGINFVEHILLLTYMYHICFNKLNQKLGFEIIASFIIWFIYSNLICTFEIASTDMDKKVYIYISLTVCYLFLIINAIIPILISFSYKFSTSYFFTPKLMENLYLFLSNETCYMKFKSYLNRINGNPSLLLKLYSDIMSYKLGYKLELNNELGFAEALNIKNEFFGNDNKANIPDKLLEKIKNDCKSLDNNSFDKDMFDEALKYCYSELQNLFEDFKRTEGFKDLQKEFFLTSYIHSKMCNIGLINKF